jgi:hypothetical protein
VRARCDALDALIRSRGAAGTILEATQDLATELARPDLFGAAW